MRNQQPSQKRENSLKSNLQLQAKVMPASLKLPVYTFHALMHKRKHETCIAELKSATSNAGSKPTLAPPLSGMAQIKMGVVPSTSTQPKPAETKSTPKPAETKSAPRAKDKVDVGKTAKGSDDPIKTHNRYGAFNEDDMETEVSPSSPRKHLTARIPTA